MSVPVSNRSASDGHAGLIRDIVDPIDTYADAENPALEWSRARMRAAILAACGVES